MPNNSVVCILCLGLDLSCADVNCCEGASVGQCSGFVSGFPCYCDATCLDYNDCCPDAQSCYDPCLSNPCSRGGSCVANQDGLSYTCLCLPGSTGGNCEDGECSTTLRKDVPCYCLCFFVLFTLF